MGKYSKIEKKIAGLSIVTIHDDTNLEPGMCCNGGYYGFWTRFDRQADGTWLPSCHTTADFTYCPRCGDFNDHWEWDLDSQDPNAGEWICPDPEPLTTRQLIQELVKVERDKTTGQYTGEKARYWEGR